MLPPDGVIKISSWQKTKTKKKKFSNLTAIYNKNYISITVLCVYNIRILHILEHSTRITLINSKTAFWWHHDDFITTTITSQTHLQTDQLLSFAWGNHRDWELSIRSPLADVLWGLYHLESVYSIQHTGNDSEQIINRWTKLKILYCQTIKCYWM